MKKAEEIVTPEMKAKIYEVIKKGNDLAEEQSKFIDELQKRVSAAEGVCYTAKGVIEHGKDALGSVYLNLLQSKVQKWIEGKEDTKDDNMNSWISVKDDLPESGEEVLTYYFDEGYDIHQIGILDYFRKDVVFATAIDCSIDSPELRLLDSLFNPANQIKAPEDGFYIYDEAEATHWRKHAGIITHWMPLPNPPEEQRGRKND